MAHSGLFITLEGIDGAGKSSHVAALTQAFEACGRMVTATREPGGTPLAESLRELLLHAAMDPLTEALLMFAARRDHVQTVIQPALRRGDVVICDRFTDATFAYQGYGRHFDLGTLRTLEKWVQTTDDGWLEPHLTLWFDVPPAVAAARLAGTRRPDKFEAMPYAFFERVAQGYADRAHQSTGRLVRIDGAQSPKAVWQDVHALCVGRGWLKGSL
jgi:dTMP kinase